MSKASTKLQELLKKSDICMFTTMTSEGKHVSRPMSMQQAEFDGDLWFLTYDNSDKAKDIKKNPEVNISFSDSHFWISLSGKAEIVHDKAKAKELWSPFHKAWFPDGLETPHLALIKVHAHTAEYWSSPSNAAVQLIGMVTAAVTGNEANAGENKQVKL